MFTPPSIPWATLASYLLAGFPIWLTLLTLLYVLVLDPKKPPPPPFVSSAHRSDGKQHLLLAATGSVATIKIPQILRALSAHPNLSIRLILTPRAEEFLRGQAGEQPSLESLRKSIPNLDGVYADKDEWIHPWTRGAPILHIELRRWADLMVVAPLSAESLSKMVEGRAGDLVAGVMRAWDTTGTIDMVREGGGERGQGKKRILVAPAMNTAMWNHPVTAKQIGVLEGEWGVSNGGWVEVLRPVEKELACGDTGAGAMRDWREIVRGIEERLGLRKEEEGEGVEREYVDVGAEERK